MKQWIEIEEDLKTELKRLLLVMMNSNHIHFIQDKLYEYHCKISIEKQELNLENISDRKLRNSISYLENKLDIYSFEDFLLSQDKDINPLLRLYSQLKKEKMKRTKEENLTNIFELVEFYLGIYEQRLLESYENVFKKEMPEVDIRYFPMLYNTMYSFVGLEEIASYKIHVTDWVKDIESFQIIEKAQISELFYEYLKRIDNKSIDLLIISFLVFNFSISHNFSNLSSSSFFFLSLL